MLDATSLMRTTLQIDDDVLAAAKVLAENQKRPIGNVISDLARQALWRTEQPQERNGIPLLPTGSKKTIITLEIVNALRDDAP
jgi:superfamily II DNA or RNA helicase